MRGESMFIAAAVKNVMLDSLADTLAYVSIHEGDPGRLGSNEVSDERYERRAIEWKHAIKGTLDSSNEPVFDLPGGTYTHFGVWTAQKGGDYLVGGPLIGAAVMSGPGRFELYDADISVLGD